MLEARQKDLRQLIGRERGARRIAARAQRAVGAVPLALTAHQSAENRARFAIWPAIGSSGYGGPDRLLRRIALATLAEAVACVEARGRREDIELLIKIHTKLKL